MFTVERNNIGKTRLIFDLRNSSWLIIVWVCVYVLENQYSFHIY